MPICVMPKYAWPFTISIIPPGFDMGLTAPGTFCAYICMCVCVHVCVFLNAEAWGRARVTHTAWSCEVFVSHLLVEGARVLGHKVVLSSKTNERMNGVSPSHHRRGTRVMSRHGMSCQSVISKVSKYLSSLECLRAEAAPVGPQPVRAHEHLPVVPFRVEGRLID